MAKKYGLVYVRKTPKTKEGEAGRWHEKKKLEAVTTYLATGNLTLTSRIINVPHVTVKNWATQDWWKEHIADIQNENDLKLNKKLENIVDKSLAAVNNILTEGDYVYDSKRGIVVRVPPKLRDVNKIAGDLIDKQMMLRKQTKPVSQSNENTEGRLLKLAEQFAKFVTGKEPNEKIVTEVVEGEFEMMPPNYVESIKAKEEREHALYDQRKEGLQEGASLGAQEEAQQGEGSCSKEPSEVSSG